MFLGKKKKTAMAMLAVLLMCSVVIAPGSAELDGSEFINKNINSANGQYINTNRDTKLPEDKINVTSQSVEDYQKLYETDSAVYYFRDDRDIIAVYDKCMGYLWKTGIDSGIGKDLKKLAKKAETDDEISYLEKNPVEENLNETYTNFANSLVSIEYLSSASSGAMTKASSSSSDSSSILTKIDNDRYCLEVNFQKPQVTMNVYFSFGEKSITYDIPIGEIGGAGIGSLCNLYITPFLGSSGGIITRYNRETKQYDITEPKDAPTGYVLLPDGSGALVRFKDNSAAFSAYIGDVYGPDVSQGEYYHRELTDAVALKNPVMPVFGVAYGCDQVAFVAYADKGDEYMTISLTPEENITKYTWVTPVFSYNTRYHQVYNKAGEGYFTQFDSPRSFDISMTYEFLSGDGKGSTYAANYSGMALKYREHLVDTGVLSVSSFEENTIPIRIDFIMSDAQNSIVGIENVVVTTSDDVRMILEDLIDSGIANINSGLLGWQKNGLSFSKPYTQNFSSSIGTRARFSSLFSDFAERNIDISFFQDYVTVNTKMLNYYQNAVRHVSTWYVDENRESLLPAAVPITSFGYAVPNRSAEWLLMQYEGTSDMAKSMTISGIGNVLTGNFISKGNITTVSDAICMYQEALGQIQETMVINIEAPSKYLWEYTDRYLQAYVGHSQYLFETDAVPFLQMVLHGTMEVYGPYSNFSFYTQSDILKMIDYNLLPSFILSAAPSYKLSKTISCDLYSTEYSLYKELICDVYTKVNAVLNQVSGYDWIGRTVADDGVIVNTYIQGEQKKRLLLTTLPKKSAMAEQ